MNTHPATLARCSLNLAFATIALLASDGTVLRADVKLPAIISDHMVVQADESVPIWGWAEPEEEITVSLAGHKQTTQAGANGKWMTELGKSKATDEPQTLTIKGKQTIVVRDVLIGEVWLASGQSNMAFLVNRGLNPEQEGAAAKFPRLRMFTVAGNPQRTPQADCQGSWVVCSPDTVEKFSAVAYFFGRELLQTLDCPFGMINSSVGGTDIAAWTSEDIQTKVPELQAQLEKWAEDENAYDPDKAKALLDKQLAVWKEKSQQAKAAGKPLPPKPRLRAQPSRDSNHPANLFNGMIAPLVPYALRGAIWYQGEHNCSSEEKARLYDVQLPLLIEDWRRRWANDFPFAWVQLPNFERKDYRPLVREAMLHALRVKDTGMAITIDIGEAGDNHPKNKQEVGRRLALWALGTVYGQKVPSMCGPIPAGNEVRGSQVIVRFDHADEGLAVKSGDLAGFEIAGEDRQWKPAEARIEGNTVLVSNADIKQPVAVRYSWASNPSGNLYNSAGLPASPFRTDDWNP